MNAALQGVLSAIPEPVSIVVHRFQRKGVEGQNKGIAPLVAGSLRSNRERHGNKTKNLHSLSWTRWQSQPRYPHSGGKGIQPMKTTVRTNPAQFGFKTIPASRTTPQGWLNNERVKWCARGDSNTRPFDS
jgi:hypothetical protein